MNSIKLAFIITLFSGLSTLLGMIGIFFIKKNNLKIITISLAFASGAMYGVSILDLIPEGITFFSSVFSLNKIYFSIIIFVLLGFFIAFLIDKLLPENNEKVQDKSLFRLGFMSLMAIILHNIPEGIVTFLTSSLDVKLGLTLAIAIAMHNIPEGISIALPIYFGTHSKLRTFIYTLIASLSELLGAVFAYLFLPNSINNIYMGIIFSVIAGLMIYIALIELLPNSFKNKNYLITILSFTFGIIFIQLFIR